MFGSNRLFGKLNITAITDLLDDYGDGSAIFPGTRIPKKFKGTEVINYYRTGLYDATAAYNEYTYNINCRSALEIDSQTMAKAVIDNLNETAVTDGRLYCSLLATIPPFDETDLYNTPVTVIMKSK